MVIIKAQSLCA